MCDCYWAKCQICDKEIPIHIADFNYPRTDVEAWCQSHIPNGKGIEIFEMMEDEDRGEEIEFPKGMKFGLRLKHGELRPSYEGVEPNLTTAESIAYCDFEFLDKK